MNIGKMRFTLNPKEAFKKFANCNKISLFEKRDGSIIYKVKVGETTINKYIIVKINKRIYTNN